MRNKILIFLDVVAHKNQLQAEAIKKFGFEPFYFVSKYNSRSETFLKKHQQVVVENKFLKRFNQVRSWLHKNRSSIHHIEVYPGGRFSFVYISLAKMWGIRSVCVERGDLLYYNKQGYSRAARFSMWACYRMADIIWYKEPYMKPILDKLNKNLFFLHNAVKSQPKPIIFNDGEKDITFLWLNRVIPQRRFDWFITVLAKPDLADTRNCLAGMDHGSLFIKEQQYVVDNKPANLLLADYTNSPVDFYKRSKFFVLPADVVFANNSLLEAMSYGVVPLVSEQQGSSMIVDNGINGFIFKHTFENFEAAILKAKHLSSEQYKKMSLAAIEKIQKEFSEEKFQEAIKMLYDRLNPLAPG